MLIFTDIIVNAPNLSVENRLFSVILGKKFNLEEIYIERASQ